jgi:hypothetical protein
MCGSDESHLYPVRNFTYRKEQVRADKVIKYSKIRSFTPYDIAVRSQLSFSHEYCS